MKRNTRMNAMIRERARESRSAVPPLILILFLFLLLSPRHVLKAQAIRGAVIAGGNLTQVDGDEVYGFHKVGWNAGAAAIIPFGPKWSVSLENTFTQKGSYQSPQYNDSLSFEYKLRLNYVEVPVMLHFTDKETVTFGAGFSWGRLVGIEEYEHGTKVETTTLLGGPYDRNDWSILADVRFRLAGRFHFNARYAYSLASIRTRTYTVGNDVFNRDQFNNIVTFRVLYVFNEAIEKESRRKQ